MKELSIEEKATRYDEAIKVARQYYNDKVMPIGTNFKLEKMFPELKESEDERIKYEIIGFVVQSIHRGGGTPISEEQENKWIAWLEKQSEKNYDFPLAHEKMETERWKEACKAACNDVNYRSHYGLTETRDDYFVDGVHWADEHPKQNLSQLNRVVKPTENQDEQNTQEKKMQ